MDTLVTPKIRFCACCGEEITNEGKIGQLVDKACPSSNLGEVIYTKQVKHYICQCGFVSTFVENTNEKPKT